MLFCAVFTRISVRFCGIGTPLTPPSCSVVWSPHTSRNISKLERIQRRATKFILKTNDDYEQRRKKLNLLSLEQRRFLFDVLFLYKTLNDYINIDLSTYVQFFSQSLIGIL